MRIGFITGEYPPMQGGIGAYTQILARHLHDLGHHVAIYTDARGESSDGLSLTAAVTRWDIAALRRAKAWARAERLDLISVQYQTAAYSMSPFIHFAPELLRPTPVVTTCHDLRYPYLFPKAGYLRAWIVRRLVRGSAGVITTNHEDHTVLAALRPSIRALTMIPIGSNIPVDSSNSMNRVMPRAQVGIASDTCLVAYFGLINRSKGIETLLYSLKTLLDDGLSLHLVMIGAGAGSSDLSNLDYTKEIETLIDQLHLRPHLTQTGYLSDSEVAAWLRAADIVALPFTDGASFRRGTLMAALRHGIAILTTTPHVPIPEFTDDVMAFAPPNDTAAFTDQLRSLYQNPNARAHLRQSSAQLAPRFAWEGIARETAAFFAYIVEDAETHR
jgi:glycosyltransferase involved in cell wall biosynthesis